MKTILTPCSINQFPTLLRSSSFFIAIPERASASIIFGLIQDNFPIISDALLALGVDTGSKKIGTSENLDAVNSKVSFSRFPSKAMTLDLDNRSEFFSKTSGKMYFTTSISLIASSISFLSFKIERYIADMACFLTSIRETSTPKSLRCSFAPYPIWSSPITEIIATLPPILATFSVIFLPTPPYDTDIFPGLESSNLRMPSGFPSMSIFIPPITVISAIFSPHYIV